MTPFMHSQTPHNPETPPKTPKNVKTPFSPHQIHNRESRRHLRKFSPPPIVFSWNFRRDTLRCKSLLSLLHLSTFVRKRKLPNFGSMPFTLHPNYGTHLERTFLDLILAIFSMATKFIRLFVSEIAVSSITTIFSHFSQKMNQWFSILRRLPFTWNHENVSEQWKHIDKHLEQNRFNIHHWPACSHARRVWNL